MSFYPSDFSNNERFAILTKQQARYCVDINKTNFQEICIYLAVRMCIEHDWLNHNDQFYSPNDERKNDIEFQNDCLTFTLFNDKNKITSRET
jgi:hypothetical protein